MIILLCGGGLRKAVSANYRDPWAVSVTPPRPNYEDPWGVSVTPPRPNYGDPWGISVICTSVTLHS